MWCKKCNVESYSVECEICNGLTDEDIPIEVYWCDYCKTPVVKNVNAIDKTVCPICKTDIVYLASDLRPVFPEERLLLELLIAKPFEYINSSVWAANNRYYIDGQTHTISNTIFADSNVGEIIILLDQNKLKNTYERFNTDIEMFVRVNKDRLNYIKHEATEFIKSSSFEYSSEDIVISFSGGKDSTVVADLVVRALTNPNIVHIFGNTTLEFPLTLDYTARFKRDNPKIILKVAENKEQDFYKVCEDIGPPARMMRWCCSMFKTGPITKVLNNLYKNKNILTYYGIRKSESASRSKYKRIENNSNNIKIQKQKVASPILFWKDIDIWLYILAQDIDFNDAYRLGYDRVGCWCCPNNSDRAQFLSKIYMPEQAKKWREFLIKFAVQIGKPDAEVYVDTGKWKARQGGNGVTASEDVKIKYTNCTVEENAKIYKLNNPIEGNFYTLFLPFGKVSHELGRKMINEVIILDVKFNTPILSIQPFKKDGYAYAVKIQTMNVGNHEDLQRMVGYQIRKYNICRRCLKCVSICKFRAISIIEGNYRIEEKKCKQCKMCVTAKYIDGGCVMSHYLATKISE